MLTFIQTFLSFPISLSNAVKPLNFRLYNLQSISLCRGKFIGWFSSCCRNNNRLSEALIAPFSIHTSEWVNEKRKGWVNHVNNLWFIHRYTIIKFPKSIYIYIQKLSVWIFFSVEGMETSEYATAATLSEDPCHPPPDRSKQTFHIKDLFNWK